MGGGRRDGESTQGRGRTGIGSAPCGERVGRGQCHRSTLENPSREQTGRRGDRRFKKKKPNIIFGIIKQIVKP